MDPCIKRRRAILWLALGLALPVATSSAQSRVPPCCAPCPSPYLTPSTGETDPALAGSPDASVTPFDLGEGAPAQSGSSFAINEAPNMIGALLSNSGYFYDPYSDYYSTIAIAGGDRRFKISENTSPLPRDRVYYMFNGFQQAGITADNRVIDVNRHTLGGEKTFWDGGASIEVRMPILQGLSAGQTPDGDLYNDDGVEFGNLTLIPKFIISEGPDSIWSAGLGINLPTARAASILDPGTQQPLLTVHNETVNLSPFLGWLWLPSDRTYVMSYVQADFAAGGYRVTDGANNAVGTLIDQNLFHFDVTVGQFLYRDYNARLSGIAAQVELHYTTTMQDANPVGLGTGQLGNPFNRLDLLILTAGLNFEFWNASWLTVGCAVPVRGSQDPISGLHPERPFDAEIQVFFNRYF
jgi:hypothetical protein